VGNEKALRNETTLDTSQLTQRSEPASADAETDMTSESNGWNNLDKSARLAKQNGLTAAERAELVRIADGNLLAAYTAYSNATHNQRAALKAAADDSGEFVLALIEVGLGLALPGLGRAASLALGALSKAPKAVAFIDAVINAPEFGGLVTAATKAATMSVKPNLPSGRQFNSDDEFLIALQSSFGDARAAVSASLPGMSDQQLAAVCARFDRSVANEKTYGDAISKMVSVMHKLAGTFVQHHEKWGGGHRADADRYAWTEEDLVVYVWESDDDERNPVAIVQEKRGSDPRGKPDGYYLQSYVPANMRAVAIEQTWAKKGRGPHRVAPVDIR
jgi:hypothetical protein